MITITKTAEYLYGTDILTAGTEVPVPMSDADRKISRSSFRCPTCGKPPNKKEQDKLTDSDIVACRLCSKRYHASEATVLVGLGSQKFLDIAEVYRCWWWHGTSQSLWPTQPLSHNPVPMVHVGTYQAAMTRLEAFRSFPKFLYKVKLSPRVILSEKFLWDTGDWRTDVEDYPDPGYRYVNRWESPGSISLLIDPKYLIVLDSRRVV